MTDSEMLGKILLELAKLQRDIGIIKMAMSPDTDEDGVPDGHDVQEIGGYAISMTKKSGNNGKTNPVLFLYAPSIKMPNKTLTVYGSESHLLPAFLRNRVDWRKGDYPRIVETEKPDVIAAEMYFEIPTFKVLRKHGEMQKIGHTKKTLAGTIWLSPEAQELEDQELIKVGNLPAASAEAYGKADTGAKAAVKMLATNDDVKWAVSYGAYASLDEAAAKYGEALTHANTNKVGNIRDFWRNHCMAKYAVDNGVYDTTTAKSKIAEIKSAVKPEQWTEEIWQKHCHVAWAIKQGAFPVPTETTNEAKDAYVAFRKMMKPNTDQEMWQAWRSKVASVLAEKRKAA